MAMGKEEKDEPIVAWIAKRHGGHETLTDEEALDMLDELRDARAKLRDARLQRDAAVSVAFYAGRNLFGLDDATIFKRIAESMRAWQDDDGRSERERVSSSVLAELARLTGGGEGIPESKLTDP